MRSLQRSRISYEQANEAQERWARTHGYERLPLALWRRYEPHRIRDIYELSDAVACILVVDASRHYERLERWAKTAPRRWELTFLYEVPEGE
jgi:hypothetical protein